MKRLPILAVLLVPLLVGCAGQSVPADWVKADRATHDAVAPEYSDYVNADPALSPLQKQSRQTTLKTWESRIAEHEKAAQAAGGGQ